MKTNDVNIVFQKATELFPEEIQRCITDNVRQYQSWKFTQFIARNQYSHITTAPYYSQSTGKQERFYGSLKSQCIEIRLLCINLLLKKLLMNISSLTIIRNNTVQPVIRLHQTCSKVGKNKCLD